MKKRTVVPIILIVLSLGLAVLGYFILPEQVVIQFSAGSSGNTAAPKLLAILIPTALGVGGAVAYLISKDNGKLSRNSLTVSVIGIAAGIFTIAVNSFIH